MVRHAEAETLYQQVAALGPLFVPAPNVDSAVLFGYAWCLLHSGNNEVATIDRALTAARRGLDKAKLEQRMRREGLMYWAIGVAQYRLGRVEEAIESLRKGMAKVPPQFLVYRGDLESTLARAHAQAASSRAEFSHAFFVGRVARVGLEADKVHPQLRQLRNYRPGEVRSIRFRDESTLVAAVHSEEHESSLILCTWEVRSD